MHVWESTWQQFSQRDSTIGSICGRRLKPSCCCYARQVNSVVYVFGGQLLKDGSVSNELYWMTSERLEWHLQPTRGDRPVGRHGHVAVYDPDHHQLVVFGGRYADPGRHTSPTHSSSHH
jgi:hypothetical protein